MTNWERCFGTPEKVAERFGYGKNKCSCLPYRFGYYRFKCNDCKAARLGKDATKEQQIAISLEWLQEEASR